MRPEEELRFLILGAQREGSRVMSARLAPIGLTPAQAEVIRCLADTGPISLRALGERLVCESGSPSRLVDSMVGRELVVRRENPEDRRQVTLELTAAGRALDSEVRKVEEELYAGISAQLGKDGIAAALRLIQPLLEGSASGAAIARRKAKSR